MSYIKVDLKKIENNVKNILNKYNGYDYYIGIVKGNAYGHGMYTIKTLIKNGINYLAVASLDEAIRIRKYDNDIPILCLEPIDLKFIDEVMKYNVTISIPSYEYFKQLLKIDIKKQIKIHLKIDSGMHRLGFTDKKEVKEVIDNINNHSHLYLEGIFSHFATTGIADKYWDIQLENFKDITSLIDLKKIPIVHLGRSLTLLTHPKIDFCTGIRLGIIMYGFNTTPRYSNSLMDKLRLIKADYLKNKYDISYTTTDNEIKLSQALELYSEILQIKQLKSGDCVGYGATYQVKENTNVATVNIGYSDGIGRKNSGRNVVINEKKYPIIGEIGMNMLSVKVDKGVKITDPVRIIGDKISVREVSYYIGNSTYETLSMLPIHIPRIYYYDKEKVYIEKI